jgi:hypothetical protein
MIRDIEADLGGRRDLTRIETEMINAFAGAATVLRYMTAALGEVSELDLTAYSNLASTMLRLGAKLGLSRRAKDITETPPSPAEYFRYKQQLKANGASEPPVCP